MAYVDKLKIDGTSYDIKDSEGRAETDKKIDVATTGDLIQTVSGNMKITTNGYFSVNQNGKDGIIVNNTRIDIGSGARSKLPLNLYGVPGFIDLIPHKIDDDYSYVEIGTAQGNKKFLISNNGEIPNIIYPSPTSIEKYQTLKKDGTDDITDTINTHTKNEPLFIPAGTYKISAPLQLKHSLYGAGATRDGMRGTSDTILKYTDNPTAFGTLGVVTVSGDDVTGNIVVANLDIICNGMIGGVVFTTNKYTDNTISNVSVTNVKSYGIYLQPTSSNLSRYVYMNDVAVWGFSDNKPKERWDGNIAFYWGTNSPDCICNNLLAMCCQCGFLCEVNVIGTNWITYNGIPSGGSGGTDANTWWENTCGLKVVNNDVHITNIYLDTVRRGIIFDGPGKSCAYINNLIFICNDSTATSEEGYSTLALVGSSPSAQLIVDTGYIGFSTKISSLVQSVGTYSINTMVLKLNNTYIYANREDLFNTDRWFVRAGEHVLIDSSITDQGKYYVSGVAVTGDPTQYKALAYIPKATATTATQGELRLFDDYNLDMSVLIRLNPSDSSAPLVIHAIDNRKLNVLLNTASTGTINLGYELSDSQDSLYYVDDGNEIIIYCKLPASRAVTVEVSGFTKVNSPLMLDRVRQYDGTEHEWPRWDNANGMTAIKILRPTIS